MSGVHYSSPTNSTLFSDCCKVAVMDREKKCPVCKALIYPENPESRHDFALRFQLGERRYAEHKEHIRKQLEKDRERNTNDH
jgi:hypothetical protein